MIPVRTCVGCRKQAAQAGLIRFVWQAGRWELDAGRHRAPGRGAYLCSRPCAERSAKNKRFRGLADAARAAQWKGLPALGDDAARRV